VPLELVSRLGPKGVIVTIVDWSGWRDGSGYFDATALWWEFANVGVDPLALAGVRRQLDS
jgi:hypothetical protein